jgi:hypothetical protein
LLRALIDNLGALDGGGVDGGFVGSCEQESADVVGSTNAAADSQRREATLGGALDDIEQGPAAFICGRNVEKTDLICILIVVDSCLLGRIACVSQIYKIDTLYDATVLHV